MNTALIIPVVAPTETYKECIRTLLDSSYDQDIYVVSHNKECNISDRINFVKIDNISPTDTLIYKGFKAFTREYDIIAYAHSDVVFYREWYDYLVKSWDSVDKSRIWGISIPWGNIITNNSAQKFGFGMDIYNSGYFSRLSPCNSFLYKAYKDTVEKYGGDTYYNLELLMSYETMLNHMWSVWANVRPISHKCNTDTPLLGGDHFSRYLREDYDQFFKLMGYNVEHFITVWWGYILKSNYVKVIDCINNNDFNSIDYLIDEGLSLLNTQECNTCKCRCRSYPNKRKGW
jgi:hypothetical protein